MRILHIGKYYAPFHGGIERHLQALAVACAAAGDQVGVLVHQPPGRWRGSRERSAGVEVRRVGCIAAPLYTPLSPAFPLELAHALREFAPDVLHLHWPNPSSLAALASPRARRLPWVVHWHAEIPPQAPDWRLRFAYRAYRPFEQLALARAAAIIATSNSYLEASRALDAWREKTRVIPLGIDEEVGAAGATPPNWPKAKLRLLAVGRLSYYKGFGVLLQALVELPDASLLLVGNGDGEHGLRTLADASGLAERVRFAGQLDDATLLAAYRAADAFVLPSLDRSEAFGLVLLEAMRAGLPVVASAIQGAAVSEIVVDGKTGLLVPPGNPDALVVAIRRLQSAELRERLGAAGRARWIERYRLADSVAAVRALYREIRR